MTCIVGLIDGENNKIYIGGDSAGVAGLSISIRKDPKVFKRGNFIFGFTSSFRMGQLLMCGNLKIEEPQIDEDVYHYMVTTLVESVRKLFKKGGYSKVDKNEEIGGTFLVGYKGRLFSIQSDFQVGEVYDDYMSVGCGEDYALGSLFTTKGLINLSSEERIIKALEAAEYHNGGVRKPFNIVSI
jgi:ATP-dependent protease HslVU (ClpYQ) peptidase subunit